MKMRVSLLLTVCLLFVAVIPAWSETTMVSMRDGTKLATDYVLPDGEGPFPVIFVRTVYGRGIAALELVTPVTAMGCALVVQDSRGRFESEGKDPVFADDAWGANQDGVDTINWILAQPWCNGRIGSWGGSALGITQVLTAPATDKISAQVIDIACSNLYGQLSYQGGVWVKGLCENWLTGQGSAYMIDIWKSHPTYDAFWAGLNAEPQAPKVTAPALHVGGWWDCFGQGTINNFMTRQHNGGIGAKGNQKLIIGPWPHGPRKNTGELELPDNFHFDYIGYGARFINHWLKGEQNGVLEEPAVNYYTIGDVTDPAAPGNEWRTANDWPPFPTVETAYYLTKDGGLTTAAATEDGSSLTFTYDPANPCPTVGGANLEIGGLKDGPCDQREVSNRADVLKFETKPLTEPVEITGRVKVKLYISSDAPDTDFTAKLIDVYPDGRETLMLDNIQRVKFRNGFTKPELLPVGELGELTIDLWSISLIVNKGHRIAVHISSSNYPRFEKNPNSGDDFPTETNLRAAKNTVYTDKSHPSAILLPVRAR